MRIRYTDGRPWGADVTISSKGEVWYRKSRFVVLERSKESFLGIHKKTMRPVYVSSGPPGQRSAGMVYVIGHGVSPCPSVKTRRTKNELHLTVDPL